MLKTREVYLFAPDTAAKVGYCVGRETSPRDEYFFSIETRILLALSEAALVAARIHRTVAVSPRTASAL